MKSINQTICLSLMVVVLWLAVGASNAIADIAVIVHAGHAESSLTKNQVRAIFLGKTSKYPGGGAAEPVGQAEDSLLYASFVEKVLRKNTAKLKAYWASRVFSGKGTPPQSLSDDEAIKDHVSKHKEAIGYVASDSVDDSVKVIFTVK